jgi:probable phosphoglycerate mutase
MTVTRICIVRHGETPWNAERRLQGHLEIPLNELGKKQAQATARSLAHYTFDHGYSSDLLRAKQTASTIAEQLGLRFDYSAHLRERHYGQFQGLTYQQAEQQFPEAYARFANRDPGFAFAEGGESLTQFAQRIQQSFTTLTEQHPGATLLVVTHGGVLDIVNRLCRQLALSAPRDFVIPNAALNWVEHHNDEWRILRWAEQHHLPTSLDELANG